MFAAAMLLPQVLPAVLPDRLARWVADYWPTTAGRSVMFPPNPDMVEPWVGIAFLAGVTAATTAAAFTTFRLRDI